MSKPHIVVIGAGFGGLSAVKALGEVDADITVIDRHNYHLFQPLLYQVATAGLSPQDIASPIRSVLKNQNNAKVLLDEVTDVDVETKTVKLRRGEDVLYDYLVIATGAKHSYFGKNEWAEHAPGIKNIDDAISMRRKLLLAFEKAEMEKDLNKRKAYLTFTVVGAGPTGVELAGALSELAHHALAEDFHNISPRDARIVLLDAAPRILTSFPDGLAENARMKLQNMKVDVITEAFVSNIDDDGVNYGDERIDSKTVLWCAGVQASSASKWLKVEAATRAGHVAVNKDCKVVAEGLENVFVVGDTSYYPHTKSGSPLPGVAPVAKQQGEFVGKYLKAELQGKKLPKFKYRDYGNLATIGRHAAIADFGMLKMTGAFGWLLWAIVHIYFLIGFRQRLLVTINWVWQYVTFKRGARLITNEKEEFYDHLK